MTELQAQPVTIPNAIDQRNFEEALAAFTAEMISIQAHPVIPESPHTTHDNETEVDDFILSILGNVFARKHMPNDHSH